MIKICVSGSRGKMGSRIIELAKKDTDINLSGEFDIDGDAEANIKECGCLVEFTTPKATIEHLDLCVKHKKAMVIGTTGLSDAEKEKIKEGSKDIPIVFAPNMSIGVNLLFKLVGDAAKVLGRDYKVEIVEAHHEHKKDAPRGPARQLEPIIKDAEGDVDIPIESIREGDTVGEHTITFDSKLDYIELTHRAKSRDIFAQGALAAAKFVVAKEKGLFTMKNVLSL